MDVVICFLMLASDITSAIVEYREDLMAILSSERIWALRLLLPCLGERWEEKWLEKMSIRQEPGENSLLKGSKEEKTSLNLLSMSMIGPLIFRH